MFNKLYWILFLNLEKLIKTKMEWNHDLFKLYNIYNVRHILFHTN